MNAIVVLNAGIATTAIGTYGVLFRHVGALHIARRNAFFVWAEKQVRRRTVSTGKHQRKPASHRWDGKSTRAFEFGAPVNRHRPQFVSGFALI